MEPITNERLNPFALSAKHFINSTPKSKLWYAADKVLKKALKKLKKVELLRDEKRRELALKKDKGVFDVDAQGNFQFDADGLNKLNQYFAQLDEQDSGLEPHIIEEGQFDDSKMSFDQRNSFEGIIIPVIDYEKFDWENIPVEKKEPEPAK